MVYLDSAATTQTPQCVLDAMNEYYTQYRSNVHRGFYDISIKTDQAYEASKESVAGLINCGSDEIIYTSSATDSLNKLARMLEPEITNENNIVLTEMEHHANLVPWQQFAKRTGCELRFISFTNDYLLDYQQAEKLIDKNTKVVSFVHVSNTLGTINDVLLLCALSKNVGAYSIIDASQSVAHLSVDVKNINCDFLVFSGHKMYGPTGVGVLFGKQEHLNRLEPVVFGGDMIRKVEYTDSTWADSQEKFEAGTPPIAEAIGLGAACEFIKGNKNDEVDLVQYLVDSLQTIGVNIIGPKSVKDRVGVISFTLGDAHPHDVAYILAENNICVRAGHHCTMPLIHKLGLPGTIRVSIGIYTTKEDIDVFIVVLRKVKNILNV